MTKYEFDIQMYTKICEAYSLIKQSKIDEVQAKFDNIMHELKQFHNK